MANSTGFSLFVNIMENLETVLTRRELLKRGFVAAGTLAKSVPEVLVVFKINFFLIRIFDIA